ncbi:MAG: GerMN domain-containing protein [Acidimicrobiia bacterium]|nr:GerMN domain-containing protein [Acidimicrobiia bacterium]
MKRIVLALSVLALVATACGAGEIGNAGQVPLPSDQETTTTTTGPGVGPTTATTEPPLDDEPGDPADQLFVELFFVKEGLSAKSVIRAVDTPDVAANAIRALIEGPTPTEADTELSTSIPADTLLLGLTIEDGLATIDLSREFEVGGGSFNILSRLAQVVYTLTQFPTIEQVVFHLDGERVEVFSGEGVLLENPVSREDYATILPIEPGIDPTATAPWGQKDLPSIIGVDPTALSRVALIPEDDVLNVRQDPNASSPIVGMLLSGVVVERTGFDEITGSSVWAQIETPVGAFWVNDRYLAALVSADDFEADDRVAELLDELANIITLDGDLRAVSSRRGLYVSHHAEPIRFAYDELGTILTDPTTYQWPSNAISSDDPEFDQIPGRTFAEAVADSFVSAYDDPDTVTTVNEPIEAGNGRLASHAIPVEFQSFNYIGIHDSGDNPAYDGLDWITWYVSIDYEGGEPVIIGLTLDQWAP